MKVAVFVFCSLLLLVSLYLLVLAFQVPGWEAVLFGGGILGFSLAFAIPFHVQVRD